MIAPNYVRNLLKSLSRGGEKTARFCNITDSWKGEVDPIRPLP